MKLRFATATKTGVFSSLLSIVLACVPIIAPHAEEAGSSAVSERNEAALLNYLRPVLRSDGRAGRVDFNAGTCRAESEDVVHFPELDVRPPRANEKGGEAIRGLFRNEENVVVTAGSSTIRITIGDVNKAILGAKIRRIKLTPTEQFNAEDALLAVENSAEVQARMGEFGLRMPETIGDHLAAAPKRGMPHLPVELRNLTMDEALDRIAATFRGIVLYGACNTAPVFDIGFASVGQN